MRRLFLGELKTTSFHREENMENLAAMNMKKTSTSAPAAAMAPATGIYIRVASIVAQHDELLTE